MTIIEPACGTDENFDVTLDDQAAAPMPCPPADGGTYLPSNPLSAFNGQEANGQWQLTITDNYSGDSGNLDAWSLNVCMSSAAPEIPLFADGFEQGDLAGWSQTRP